MTTMSDPLYSPPVKTPSDWPVGRSRTLTREQRSERARNAALARNSTDAHIAALERRELTDEQRARLRKIVRRSA